MYRSPDGVMDEIQGHLSENQEAQAIVEDSEISAMSPTNIVSHTLEQLNSLAPQTPHY